VVGLTPQQLEQVEQIVAEKMICTGGELTKYEVAFMGGNKTIMFPSVNEFNEHEHIKYMQTETSMSKMWNCCNNSEDRIAFAVKMQIFYRYEFFTNILHEFTHCLQTITQQEDKTSWSAEHDASRIPMVLLEWFYENSTSLELKDLLPIGKVEEVALYFIDRVQYSDPRHHYPSTIAVQQQQEPQEKQQPPLNALALLDGYHKWCDSFGLVPPIQQYDAFAFANVSRIVTGFVKYRVALEAYLNDLATRSQTNDAKQGNSSSSTSTAVDIFTLCFKNRTGNVYNVQLNVPAHIQIQPSVRALLDKMGEQYL